jgi:rod shape-determining protein MreC
MLKRRILDYGLSAILLAIPALILHASLKEPESLNRFDQAVLRVSSPLQAGASWIIEGVGGIWNGYVWLVDVKEENDELRADNRRLREELAKARRRATDTEVIEELVGLRKRTPADTIGGRVVASSANSFFRVSRIRIDRGDSEVETGMPVINQDGLIGRIGRVYGEYADVLLTSDPSSSVDVKVQRTGSQGSLHGLGREDSYACEIEMLQRGKEPVQVGDLIVTSGLGDFPAGIEVGHVEKVTTKDYALFQEVEVTPIADFSNLTHVLVVLAKPPSADPDAAERRPAERAFGVFPY